VIAFEDVEKLVGFRFPGGSVTIQPYENWLLCDVVCSPQMPAGTAHPLYAYLCADAGMGMSLTQLFNLAGASADDGPMQGGAEIELMGALRTGVTYDVRGGITHAERKHGKRAGTFDIVTYRMELLEHGEVVAASTNSVVFPRRS
jgi:hypothetical protein